MGYFDNGLLIFDGAMGTMLGETDGVPELLNINDPEKIKKIHTAYLESGANVITANTFGANRLKLCGSGRSVLGVVSEGVKIARECASGCKDAYVSLDVGPLGKLLAPMGVVSFEEAVDIFGEIVRAGKDADFISIETMTDTYELKAALLAAKENSHLPVIATVSIDENGRMLCGADIRAAIALIEGLKADALGLNCGFGPEQFEKYFSLLQKYSSTPLALQPNAGLPYVCGGETVYDLTPEDFAGSMEYFAKNGAQILGGCCGTTPRHIKLMAERCRGITPKKPENKNYTVVSSYRKAVGIGERPIVIGERINPTGKKRLKEALIKGDMNYVLGEGLSQVEAGADILDVNVGLPGISEAEMMAKVVFELQSVIDVPLQIDSGSPEVLERAMRLYNGKPLVNSVNGKEEVMSAVFPLVQKYGGAVVALTLDENGIPETAQGRLEIAEKIIVRAAEYGIDKKDIVVDTLTLSVTSDKDAPGKTLEALELVSEKLGVRTVLGVSNVSFGLPQRDNITRVFFTLALEKGLSCAIINPLSEAMMSALYAHNVLTGRDPGCERYAAKFSGGAASVAVSGEEPELGQMIRAGMKSMSYDKTKKLLLSTPALDIINNSIIPALDTVGAEFEKNKVFLPGLLASAEAAQNAFSAIKESTHDSGGSGEKILLATVQGDIHDIGKNIVKLLLENYGYKIYDLGRDVAPEIIVETAKQESIKIVGLSALMTTTVASMEKTIKALRSSGHDCKIIVGGAVLTKEYAEMIGADFYAKDALSAIAFLKDFRQDSF